MTDRAILISIFSFVLGVFASSIVFISPLVGLLFFVIACGVLVAEKVWEGRVGSEVFLIFLALTSFSLGGLRYAVKDFHELKVPLSEGVVVSEPEFRDNATRLVFKSDNGEKVLVSTDLYSPVEYGDRVVIGAKFERPGIIASETGRSFDYAKYLAKDDIYYTASFAEVEVVGSGFGHPLKSGILRAKKSFVERVRATFAEPYASLLSGLLLAGKDAMPKDILDEFRRAGLIHIVVLSGYNITIIADFLRRVFEKFFLLTKFAAIPALASGASIAGIILFVLMTGAEATVVRASLMVLTVIVAKMLGRKYSASRALLLAGFLMLLENPKVLVFDPSFQLSFLATLALIYVVPIVEKYLSRGALAKWDTLRTTIATTLSTQLTVLPLLVYMMGEISLVSLPANILVLLIIPYTMFLGFIAAGFSYISTFVALPIAFVANLFLAWILGVGEFFSNLSLASVAVPEVPFILVALTYLGGTLIYLWRNSPRRSAS